MMFSSIITINTAQFEIGSDMILVCIETIILTVLDTLQ